MRKYVKQADDKVPVFASVGTIIYVGLMIRVFSHFFARAPWPGFTIQFNRLVLIFSTVFWAAGILALWVPKTAASRMINAIAVFSTFVWGFVLRAGAGTQSSEGLVYIGFGALLGFLALDDLRHRASADGSYLPNQEEARPPEDILDEEEPEPPIDEHRLVG